MNMSLSDLPSSVVLTRPSIIGFSTGPGLSVFTLMPREVASGNILLGLPLHQTKPGLTCWDSTSRAGRVERRRLDQFLALSP
jgi:hypothetical protein